MTPVTPVNVTPGVVDSFQPVDLSAHIGDDSGKVAIAAFHVINTNAESVNIGARKKGSTDAITGTLLSNGHDVLYVGVAGDNIAEFQVAAGVEVWFIGYWTTDEAYALTNVVEKTINVSETWTDIDISADTLAAGTPDAIGAIFMVKNTAALGRTSAFRKRGSTDNRANAVSGGGLRGIVMGVDAAQVCQHMVNFPTSLKCYLVGWIFANAEFPDNAVEYSPNTSDGTYTEEDLSATVPAGANGVFYHSYQPGNTPETHTVRKAGSSYGDDQFVNGRTGVTRYSWVEVDPVARTVEQATDHFNRRMFVYGWTTPSGGGSVPVPSPSPRTRLMKVIC